MALRTKEDQLIEFACFYCFCPVQVLARGRFQIKKAHCGDIRCAQEHIRLVCNREHARKYEKYLREIQNRLPNYMEIEIKRLFKRRKGHLFRGSQDLGAIKKEDKNWFLVETYSGGAQRIYSKRQCLAGR